MSNLIVKRNSIYTFFVFYCVIYVLMRPVLQAYVTIGVKVLFVILLMIGCAQSFLKHPEIWFNKNKIITNSFFVFYTYIIFNGLILGGVELLYFGIERYIFLTFPFFAIVLVDWHHIWDKILRFIIIFGVLDSFCSIYEFLTHDQLFPLANVNDTVFFSDTLIRTYGLNGEYFTLAIILSVTGLAALYKIRFEKSKIDYLFFLIVSVGLLTTGSRGLYVSYAVGILIMFLFENRDDKGFKINFKRVRKVFYMFFFLSFLLWLLVYTNFETGNYNIDVVLTRIRLIFNWSSEAANAERIERWIWTISEWKEAPFFGKGACWMDSRSSFYVVTPESGVLKRFAELGMVGACLQYFTMFLPIAKGIKRIKKNNFCTPKYIFFLAVLGVLLTEDIILQMYTELEYTVLIWTCISFLAFCEKNTAFVKKINNQ